MALTSTITFSGATITAGNIVTVAIQHASLAHGTRSIAYTVLATDTLATIATAVASAITADPVFGSRSITASAVGAIVTVKWPGINPADPPPVVTATVTAGPTLSVAISTTVTTL